MLKAKNYSYQQGRPNLLELEDFIQVGIVGLMKCLDKYDINH